VRALAPHVVQRPTARPALSPPDEARSGAHSSVTSSGRSSISTSNLGFIDTTRNARVRAARTHESRRRD
jgi:hypothetical protein